MFSTGVPVSAMRLSASSALTARVCLASGFLIACASSTTASRQRVSADPVEPQQGGVAGHDEIGPRQLLGRGRLQPLGRREGGMGDENLQRRRETLGLRRPVGEQRGRRDDQARPSLAVVARRASAAAPAPGWSCRAPCRRRGRRRGRGAPGSRASAGRRPGRAAGSPSEPSPGWRGRRASRARGRRRAPRRAMRPAFDVPPGGVGRLRRLARADVGAGQEPHRLAEGDALLRASRSISA